MNSARILSLSLVFASGLAAQSAGGKVAPPKAETPPKKAVVADPDKPEEWKKAQEKKAQEKAKKQAAAGKQDKKKAPADHSPDNPKAVTVKPIEVDTTALLQKSLATAAREETFLKDVKTSGGLLNLFLRNRKLAKEMQTKYDPQDMGPMPKKKLIGARLLGDGEKATLPKDVVFTVQSVPVKHSEYQAALAAVKASPRGESSSAPETVAIAALIEQKAGQGLFPKEAAMAMKVIHDVQARLKKGEKFADLAAQFSQDQQTASKGGVLPTSQRSNLSPSFTLAAGRLAVGEVSQIAPTTGGYQIIRMIGKKAGETPDADQITAARIVRYYNGKADCEKMIQERIRSGKLDIAFRDSKVRKLAPKQFR